MGKGPSIAWPVWRNAGFGATTYAQVRDQLRPGAGVAGQRPQRPEPRHRLRVPLPLGGGHAPPGVGLGERAEQRDAVAGELDVGRLADHAGRPLGPPQLRLDVAGGVSSRKAR